MPDQGTRLPTAWWRRALTAIDGLDVGLAVSVVLIAVGLFLLWGLGVAILGTGTIGLAGTIALLRRGDAAARRLES